MKDEFEERKKKNLDPVETVSGKITTGHPILTTSYFVTADTMISIDEQINKIHEITVSTAEWNSELQQSHDRRETGKPMSPERASLFDFVRETFKDTTWWREPLNSLGKFTNFLLSS